jgi:hypothetical protein
MHVLPKWMDVHLHYLHKQARYKTIHAKNGTASRTPNIIHSSFDNCPALKIAL